MFLHNLLPLLPTLQLLTAALVLVWPLAGSTNLTVLAAEPETGLEFRVSAYPPASYTRSSDNQALAMAVRAYLLQNQSPLAEYAETIIKQKRWQMALAVSKVESSLGKFCADNNCSGIGVHPDHPSWRKYANKEDWFVDLSQLLQKPLYSERYTTCARMRGVYVVPGSDNWVFGCNQVYKELMAITNTIQDKKEQASDLENNHSEIASLN